MRSIDQYNKLQAYVDRAITQDDDESVEAPTVGLSADVGRVLGASEHVQDEHLLLQGVSLEDALRRIKEFNPDIDQPSFAIGALTALLYVQHGYTQSLPDRHDKVSNKSE